MLIFQLIKSKNVNKLKKRISIYLWYVLVCVLVCSFYQLMI